jgi:hypothetical protein
MDEVKCGMCEQYIAREDAYFCYPNNFHHYAQLYKNTFQHGGISLEEMIIPVVRLESRVG